MPLTTQPILESTPSVKHGDDLNRNLVDVTVLARELGFRWPVFLTSTVWDDCVRWSHEDRRRQCYQEATSRLTGVLRGAIAGIQSSIDENHSRPPLKIEFCCWRVPRDGKSQRTYPVPLTLIAQYNERLHGYHLIITTPGESL